MSAARHASVPLTQAAPTPGAAPTTLKYDAAAAHPVAGLAEGREAADATARRALQAATYGSAFPLRRLMTESVLGQFGRLPGLPSSGVALDVLAGRDADLGFEDYLNLPSESPEGDFGGGGDGIGAVHEAMEKALGIAAKNQF
jgi:Proteasome maturation factor UMP1